MQVTRNSTSGGSDWSPRTQHFLNQKISFGHMKDLIWSIHYAKKEKKKRKKENKRNRHVLPSILYGHDTMPSTTSSP
jgi:hypothetical protein